MNKGDRTPLLYTQSKRHRIVAGLSWDARGGKVSLMERARGDSQYDLDLSAYIYDCDGDFVDVVTPEALDAIDDSGAIYHSGDHQTGEGHGDDESISVELINVPDDVCDIFFLAETSSTHFFGDMAETAIRIADGMNDRDLLYVELDEPEADTAIAYVFAHIYRSKDSKTGWMLHYIGDFPNIEQIDEWGEYFKRYLG